MVDARTEFVFALDIAAAMAKVLFGEIREMPFADKLEVTNTVFGVKADQTLHVVIDPRDRPGKPRLRSTLLFR